MPARKYVFIVGSPRSGTTWLQLLLNQHSEVATSQETHLFHNYLGPLDQAYRGALETRAERGVGLHNVLSPEEFYGLCRSLALRALEGIAAGRPDARVVVEKSPEHGRYGELILRLIPDAHFIHLIRDPRDVVASLQSAGRGWGRTWASSLPAGSARRWADSVRRAREIASRTPRYRELRYEDLLEKGPERLGELFAWLGLRAEPELCERAVRTCSIENLRSASPEIDSPWSLEQEPPGFYRKGRAGGWRTDLTRSELRVVEHLAGDLMAELGYARELPPSRHKPLTLAGREVLGRLRDTAVAALSRR